MTGLNEVICRWVMPDSVITKKWVTSFLAKPCKLPTYIPYSQAISFGKNLLNSKSLFHSWFDDNGHRWALLEIKARIWIRFANDEVFLGLKNPRGGGISGNSGNSLPNDVPLRSHLPNRGLILKPLYTIFKWYLGKTERMVLRWTYLQNKPHLVKLTIGAMGKVSNSVSTCLSGAGCHWTNDQGLASFRTSHKHTSVKSFSIPYGEKIQFSSLKPCLQ